MESAELLASVGALDDRHRDLLDAHRRWQELSGDMQEASPADLERVLPSCRQSHPIHSTSRHSSVGDVDAGAEPEPEPVCEVPGSVLSVGAGAEGWPAAVPVGS
ncbi:hypothetical protein AQJ23_17960 [Streptomyces antibioticus]|nr:hypothetical protein AQJ23_17960 [Streptomyces antibioticus]